MKKATRLIKALEYCEAKHLKWGVPIPDGRHIYMPDYMPWNKLCISGFASMDTSDSVEDGVRTYTTEISAKLADVPEYSAEPLAYRVTFQDGTKAVVGLSEQPFPVATITDKHGQKASESSICTLTISWTGQYMPLIIVE